MFSPTIIVIAIAVVIFMVALIAAIRRIRTCPSDRILVKYGQVGGDRMANAIHGGTTFVWPVIQGFRYLDLTPMTVDIDLRANVGVKHRTGNARPRQNPLQDGGNRCQKNRWPRLSALRREDAPEDVHAGARRLMIGRHAVIGQTVPGRKRQHFDLRCEEGETLGGGPHPFAVAGDMDQANPGRGVH